jgi:hypothetical protein
VVAIEVIKAEMIKTTHEGGKRLAGIESFIELRLYGSMAREKIKEGGGRAIQRIVLP